MAVVTRYRVTAAQGAPAMAGALSHARGVGHVGPLAGRILPVGANHPVSS
jgi:hypothetical protein